MAEGNGDKQQEVALPVPVIQGLSAGLILGQSKSEAEEFISSQDLDLSENVKNTLMLVCQFCKCKVLRPGYGTMTKTRVS